MTPHEQDEFCENVQINLIEFMLSDKLTFDRCQNIVLPEHFEDRLRPTIRFIKTYVNEYGMLPIPEVVNATTGKDFVLIPDAPQHSKWFLETIERFVQRQTVQAIILDGPDILKDSGKAAGAIIEQRIRDANAISLVTNLGTSFFDDIQGRIERRCEKSKMISTGWVDLDEKLNGGVAPGSLNIFLGKSGSGKSLFLQNVALNWVFAGMNVVYVSLELSEDLINQRFDAMVTGMGTRAVDFDPAKTAAAITLEAERRPPGDLRVIRMPEAGTTANTIRAYIREYEIQAGRKVDALVIDYLDLVYPNNDALDVANAFVKDKYVAEEMRSIGADFDIPVMSAAQMNRSAHQTEEYDHSHTAGGISKINTADNIFAIETSKAKKEKGIYELQYLKTRTSDATGRKSTLSYNVRSMRISDAIIEVAGESGQRVDAAQPTKRDFGIDGGLSSIEKPHREDAATLLQRLMGTKSSV